MTTELEMALKTVRYLNQQVQRLTQDLREARAELDHLIAKEYDEKYGDG